MPGPWMCSQPYGAGLDPGIPIVQGHVIHPKGMVEDGDRLPKSQSVDGFNVLPLSYGFHIAENGNESIGSCSDMEIQSAVRGISLHDDYEMQRYHLEDTSINFDQHDFIFP